jgi:hypothetical protein
MATVSPFHLHQVFIEPDHEAGVFATLLRDRAAAVGTFFQVAKRGEQGWWDDFTRASVAAV